MRWGVIHYKFITNSFEFLRSPYGWFETWVGRILFCFQRLNRISCVFVMWCS
jgi:hypothetical protein